MTDHLHPTLNGYLYLGKLFFKKMEQANLLPKSERADLSDEKQDSITIANFHFAKLDSIIGNYRIKLLKNDWPFISKEKKLSNSVLLNPQNKADSLAAEVLDDKVSWETAHRKLATHYLERKNLNGFLKEMDALISQYPVIVEYYDYVSNILIQLKDYKRAYKYLKQGYEIKPNAYKTKWLGTINLYNNKLSPAEKYLDESLKYDTKDPQIWYNLAGIYVKRHSYKKALELVNKALALESNYPEAVNLQKQLQNAVYGRINSN
jgi:predicted Zn-dependent protease